MKKTQPGSLPRGDACWVGHDVALMPVFPFANRALPISKARTKHEPLVLQRTNKHTI